MVTWQFSPSCQLSSEPTDSPHNLGLHCEPPWGMLSRNKSIMEPSICGLLHGSCRKQMMGSYPYAVLQVRAGRAAKGKGKILRGHAGDYKALLTLLAQCWQPPLEQKAPAMHGWAMRWCRSTTNGTRPPQRPLSLLKLAAGGDYVGWTAEQRRQLTGCPLSKLIVSTRAKHLVSNHYSMDTQHMFLFI